MTTDNFTLVLGTNHFSLHQYPLASSLADLMGSERFQLALFVPVNSEGIKRGWMDDNDQKWIIGPPANESDRQKLYAKCLAADVMIFGACPFELLEARTKAGKLTFITAERM